MHAGQRLHAVIFRSRSMTMQRISFHAACSMLCPCAGAQDVSVSGPRLEIAICSATEDVLEIVTASRIEQGNEIHNTYGEHSNAELLHKYGFALLSNPFNVITIAKQAVVDAMTDIMGEELCRERCELLQDNSHLLEPDDEPFEILEGGLLSAPLVVVLVVLTTHGSKFDGWESMLRTLEVGGQSIQEPKAVAAVWDLIGAVGRKFLQDTLSSRLTKYAGGSLADEKAMLQRLCDEGSRSEQKCARIGAATLRLTEKQIILDVLSLLESTRVEKAQVEPVAQINSTNHAKRRRTAYLAVD
ncbi:unnamed protein product [Ostreobium quekettii]|uniref:Rubisco LSMT substrate-binding domain-containing protein n=1 Tax=Ostreobium quekettii TaxID=121088 RepID=A0A8S1JGQ2_9CHLO|nr:unnamed protein product [Ostreobium quekettii]|eukprot:evm.model.scf_1036.5 EVM.evm.TU.scf_1036.5   scf_1036:36381-38106(+)